MAYFEQLLKIKSINLYCLKSNSSQTPSNGMDNK